MPYKRKRSTRGRPRKQRTTARNVRRRKAKKLGRKWKSAGIPRTIVSADFQRRVQTVNFSYTQQWCVSPSRLAVANSMQIITFVMNDPTHIFGANLPFAQNLSNTVESLPDYATEQATYGEQNGLVDKQQVGNFANWSKRYEQACVIGTKVTMILRPKMVMRESQTAGFTEVTTGQVVGTGSTQTINDIVQQLETENQ